MLKLKVRETVYFDFDRATGILSRQPFKVFKVSTGYENTGANLKQVLDEMLRDLAEIAAKNNR